MLLGLNVLLHLTGIGCRRHACWQGINRNRGFHSIACGKRCNSISKAHGIMLHLSAGRNADHQCLPVTHPKQLQCSRVWSTQHFLSICTHNITHTVAHYPSKYPITYPTPLLHLLRFPPRRFGVYTAWNDLVTSGWSAACEVVCIPARYILRGLVYRVYEGPHHVILHACRRVT